ncbi:MAG: hypothetical protein GXO24_06175 [Chlorobi bacterium]|nr:hypothetical protein [Chlorobiota bacterium]
MKINVQEAGNGISELKVVLEPEDYQNEVLKELKKIRKETRMPGFRPGKVPMRLIENKYGDSVKLEIITRLLDEAVRNYRKDNRMVVFGNLIPAGEWDLMKELAAETPTAVYLFAPVPDVEWPEDKLKAVPLYAPKVSDKTLDEYVEHYRNEAGEWVETDEIDDDTLVFLNLKNEKEPDVLLPVFYNFRDIKDDERYRKAVEEVKEKKEVSGTFEELDKRFGLKEIMKAMYKQAPEFADEDKITLEWAKAQKRKPAEMNEAFFEKIFPGRGIKTEEEFRQAIAEHLNKTFENEGRIHYHNTLYKTIVDHAPVQIPEEFLEKYIRRQFENSGEEEIADMLKNPELREHILFEALMDKFLTEKGLEIQPEEIRKSAAEEAYQRLKEYNMLHLVESDEQLADLGMKWMGEDTDFMSRVLHSARVNKFFNEWEKILNPEPVEIPFEEFKEKIKEEK